MTDIEANLRALVRKHCEGPILVAGQFVCVDEMQRSPVTRREIATVPELIGALEFRLSVLTMANAYLRQTKDRRHP
jgi:hypothetical protein